MKKQHIYLELLACLKPLLLAGQNIVIIYSLCRTALATLAWDTQCFRLSPTIQNPKHQTEELVV
jgi:hypothetical protein